MKIQRITIIIDIPGERRSLSSVLLAAVKAELYDYGVRKFGSRVRTEELEVSDESSPLDN